MRIVESWANQVVHGGVDYHEFLIPAFLAIEHSRQQDAGVTDDRPAGFQVQVQTESRDLVAQRACEFADRRSRFVRSVSDTQAASEVDVMDGKALGAQAGDQIEYAIRGLHHRIEIE
jgi:hypothetical protein